MRDPVVDLTKLPPGPKSGLLGALGYLRDPEGVVLSMRRYGEPFTLPGMGGPPIVVVWSPEWVKAMFGADPDTFAPYAADAMAPILGRGSVLLQHGATHRRARRLLQPPFHSTRVGAYGAAMGEATRRHLEATPTDRAFPIEDVFREISIDVIIRTVFGIETGEGVARCRAGILDSLAAFSPLLAMFGGLRRDFGGVGPWARFRRRLDAVHELLRQEIRARRDRPPGTDVLSLLVAARDEDGQPMEEQEIVEQLFTMVVAGHETTATALAWAVNELLLEPALVEALLAELEPTGGDPDALAKLPLLDQVCAETLRLHPLAPMVSRKLLQPFEIAGHRLPEGVGLGASLLLSHYREETFPEPSAFRPSRFAAGKAFSPYEYYPWGGGSKRCLGAAFAYHEMKVVLGSVLLHSRLELESPARARPQARQATVGPRGGVRVRRVGRPSA